MLLVGRDIANDYEAEDLVKRDTLVHVGAVNPGRFIDSWRSLCHFALTNHAPYSEVAGAIRSRPHCDVEPLAGLEDSAIPIGAYGKDFRFSAHPVPVRRVVALWRRIVSAVTAIGESRTS